MLEIVADELILWQRFGPEEKEKIINQDHRETQEYVYNKNWDNVKFNLNKTHLRVMATIAGYERSSDVIIPANYWRTRDLVLPYGEAWLKGFRLYDYPGIEPYWWANTSNCFHMWTNFTWVTIPTWIEFVTRY